jgi:hypothetical protein
MHAGNHAAATATNVAEHAFLHRTSFTKPSKEAHIPFRISGKVR